MTKQEAIDKLPSTERAMDLAKELYPTVMNTPSTIVNEKRQAFLDGINHCKFKLSFKSNF